MQYKNLLFTILGVFLSINAYCQAYNERPEFINANNVWCFGQRAGLDFTGGTPTPIVCEETSLEGTGSVAHRLTGDLLFYSFGDRVRNANHLVMPNGSGMLGASSSTAQGICIVPMVGDTSKYYLFSLRGISDGGPIAQGCLFYSIVDMTLDGGLGDVVAGQKNISLDSDTLSEAMIAIPGDNCDVWLVVHKMADSVFKAYHITTAGIDPTPVISATGGQIQNIGPVQSFMISTMSASPDRKKIAITNYAPPSWLGVLGMSGVIVSDFDPGTGVVSGSVLVDQLDLVSYSSAFSPDNSKIYFFNEDLANSVYEILQYDITSMNTATIGSTKQVVSGPLFPFGMCVASYTKLYNGKIYFSYAGQDTIGVINLPNLSGTACSFDPNAIQLITNPVTHVKYGMSNEVVYAFPPDTTRNHYLDTVICENTDPNAQPYLTAMAGFSAYEWDNGSTGATRTINAPGTYWVLCKDECHSRIDTFNVTLVNPDFARLGPDTVICDGSQLLLEPVITEDDVSLEWQDGSTKKDFKVTETGTYWLSAKKLGCVSIDTIKVTFLKDIAPDLGDDIFICKGKPINIQLNTTRPSGGQLAWSTGSGDESIYINDTGTYHVTVSVPPCKASDTIRIDRQVCECSFEMPNGFTPNSDGNNDLLRPVIEAGCGIKEYVLNVYNRFGQRVYSGSDPALGWDGTQDGTPVEVGTYMYELRFKGGTQKIPYYQKGDVVLLR
jgi:gliding motility-associated-like protein